MESKRLWSRRKVTFMWSYFVISILATIQIEELIGGYQGAAFLTFSLISWMLIGFLWKEWEAESNC